MSEPGILYERDGLTARLTINQPARMNAMTFDMWLGLADAVGRAEADPEIRAIVLTGAGDRAFCAGADISQFGEKRTGPEAAAEYDRAVARGTNALIQSAKPTIALIRGICFGGGLGLALACDLRIGHAYARFRVPAARLGLGYSYKNIAFMVSKLGQSVTADILLSARVFDAPDAARLGVLNSFWVAESFEREAAAYINAVAGNAPMTLSAIKMALAELAKPAGEQDSTEVDRMTAACYQSQDYVEGQAAFREKRNPTFRGK
jgi:enoyl-CoA hydratase/carnithine racemase